MHVCILPLLFFTYHIEYVLALHGTQTDDSPSSSINQQLAKSIQGNLELYIINSYHMRIRRAAKTILNTRQNKGCPSAQTTCNLRSVSGNVGHSVEIQNHGAFHSNQKTAPRNIGRNVRHDTHHSNQQNVPLHVRLNVELHPVNRQNLPPSGGFKGGVQNRSPRHYNRQNVPPNVRLNVRYLNRDILYQNRQGVSTNPGQVGGNKNHNARQNKNIRQNLDSNGRFQNVNSHHNVWQGVPSGVGPKGEVPNRNVHHSNNVRQNLGSNGRLENRHYQHTNNVRQNLGSNGRFENRHYHHTNRQGFPSRVGPKGEVPNCNIHHYKNVPQNLGFNGRFQNRDYQNSNHQGALSSVGRKGANYNTQYSQKPIPYPENMSTTTLMPAQIQAGVPSRFCNLFGCECVPPPGKICCEGFLYDSRTKECRRARVRQ